MHSLNLTQLVNLPSSHPQQSSIQSSMLHQDQRISQRRRLRSCKLCTFETAWFTCQISSLGRGGKPGYVSHHNVPHHANAIPDTKSTCTLLYQPTFLYVT